VVDRRRLGARPVPQPPNPSHDDIDVALLRRDQLALYRRLEGWDLRYATPERTLVPWDGRRLERPVHGVWARRSTDANAPWTCEFLLSEHDADRWAYRRNTAITQALDEIGAARDGIPFLGPEIVLLYKSKRPTTKDEADFDAVEPHLSEHQRAWLHHAHKRCDGSSEWQRRLRGLPPRGCDAR